MLVWQDNKLLLIERKKPPFGFAPPAGHVDDDASFDDAAKRELSEEVGLDSHDLIKVLEGRRDNPCRRQDGSWHYWEVYEVRATGTVNASADETKQARWFARDEIKNLSDRTDAYLDGKITEDDWQKSPGLEPIWSDFFHELRIIE